MGWYTRHSCAQCCMEVLPKHGALQLDRYTVFLLLPQSGQVSAALDNLQQGDKSLCCAVFLLQGHAVAAAAPSPNVSSSQAQHYTVAAAHIPTSQRGQLFHAQIMIPALLWIALAALETQAPAMAHAGVSNMTVSGAEKCVLGSWSCCRTRFWCCVVDKK
jgi:hypothetical protein